MKIEEGESFQEAGNNSDNCHCKFNKMRKEKCLSDSPVPRSLTASVSFWWGMGKRDLGEHRVQSSRV